MDVLLTDLAHDQDLRPLWTAVHKRLCSGVDPRTVVTVRVEGLSVTGLSALRSLVDTSARRRRNGSAVVVQDGLVVVPLRDLLAVLGLGANDLVPLVELAVGRPVVDLAAERRRVIARRSDLWTEVEAMLPAAPVLVARMRAAGTDDEASVRRMVAVLARVLVRLPSAPPTSLAKLSHDLAGDPHYLDLDRLAGMRLVAAVAEVTGQPEPIRPDRVRAMLAGVGVLADRLSATVLLHQVRVLGDGVVDRRLREAIAPVALTLLDLTVHPPTFAPQLLTVVENPSVLEAALVERSPLAFACTSGQLGSVDHALLQLAVDQGVSLRYSGDLDGPGLQIANSVSATYGAELVAMSAKTVQSAGPQPSTVPRGEPPPFVDQHLREALKTSGRVVYQEHDTVLSELFAQLDHDAGSQKPPL
ncbi:DUF2399 domain-containing protein [Actinokineospora globicatena]|uniref:TIGR02679 family protein n=1 Tax=Actinokineospora globicatena TaxID=103729 RepID=A0A9W6V8K2_9PSEU|nr:DUF2399 domain-containing protein [Actinokineospora globicatena]GLW94055.1 hypothetical protein Aglo03_48710 [Actinokineospora globicatena]